MKGFGWLLIVAALVLLVTGIGMDPSVATYSTALAVPDRVTNLALISNRELTVQAGLALFVAGCVLIGAAHVRDALASLAARLAPPPPPAD